jgi:hypothetical protein
VVFVLPIGVFLILYVSPYLFLIHPDRRDHILLYPLAISYTDIWGSIPGDSCIDTRHALSFSTLPSFFLLPALWHSRQHMTTAIDGGFLRLNKHDQCRYSDGDDLGIYYQKGILVRIGDTRRYRPVQHWLKNNMSISVPELAKILMLLAWKEDARQNDSPDRSETNLPPVLPLEGRPPGGLTPPYL